MSSRFFILNKVASNIEENGIVGVRPMLMKKLQSSEKVKIGVIGDSMSGKSSLIEAFGGDVQEAIYRIFSIHRIYSIPRKHPTFKSNTFE